jgi:predicted amidohydrolase YtcJ
VIAPGCLADLVVLPTDPLKVGPAELVKTPIDITIIAGRVVFERGRPVESGRAAVSRASA